MVSHQRLPGENLEGGVYLINWNSAIDDGGVGCLAVSLGLNVRKASFSPDEGDLDYAAQLILEDGQIYRVLGLFRSLLKGSSRSGESGKVFRDSLRKHHPAFARYFVSKVTADLPRDLRDERMLEALYNAVNLGDMYAISEDCSQLVHLLDLVSDITTQGRHDASHSPLLAA